MMILNAYCIYDNKALQYHPPFFASTDPAAARAFGDLAEDLTTNIGRHPSDFSLYCVGTFLDTNAKLEAIIPMRHVVDAASFLRIREPQPPLFADLTQATAENVNKLRTQLNPLEGK